MANGEAWISRHGVEWEVILHRNLAKALQAMEATTVPAIALLPDDAQSHSDVTLLRLGTELNSLEEEWLAQQKIDAEENAASDAAQKQGIKFEWSDPDLDSWDDINGRLHKLCERIFSLKALTAEGLAVQAKAVTLSWCEMWMDEHAENDDRRKFIELVCEHLGVVPAPLRLDENA